MLAMAESQKQADADGKSRRLNYSTIACSPGIATPPADHAGNHFPGHPLILLRIFAANGLANLRFFSDQGLPAATDMV
jgi:hypothetical protein